MNSRLRNTSILALFFVIAVPIALAFMQAEGAVIVLSIIAVIGFFTVIFVSVIGSLENEAHPQAASDSAAVAAWKKRLGDVPETAEAGETAS